MKKLFLLLLLPSLLFSEETWFGIKFNSSGVKRDWLDKSNKQAIICLSESLITLRIKCKYLEADTVTGGLVVDSAWYADNSDSLDGKDSSYYLCDSIQRVQYSRLDSFFLWQGGVMRASFEVDYDSVLYADTSGYALTYKNDSAYADTAGYALTYQNDSAYADTAGYALTYKNDSAYADTAGFAITYQNDSAYADTSGICIDTNSIYLRSDVSDTGHGKYIFVGSILDSLTTTDSFVALHGIAKSVGITNHWHIGVMGEALYDEQALDTAWYMGGYFKTGPGGRSRRYGVYSIAIGEWDDDYAYGVYGKASLSKYNYGGYFEGIRNPTYGASGCYGVYALSDSIGIYATTNSPTGNYALYSNGNLLLNGEGYHKVAVADSQYMSKKYIDSHKSDSAIVSDSSVISAQSYNSYNSDSLGSLTASQFLRSDVSDTGKTVSLDTLRIDFLDNFDSSRTKLLTGLYNEDWGNNKTDSGSVLKIVADTCDKPLVYLRGSSLGARSTRLMYLKGGGYSGDWFTNGLIHAETGGDGPGVSVVGGELGYSAYGGTGGAQAGYRVRNYTSGLYADYCTYGVKGEFNKYDFFSNTAYWESRYTTGAILYVPNLNAGNFDVNRKPGLGIHIRNYFEHYTGDVMKSTIWLMGDSTDGIQFMITEPDSSDTNLWIKQDGTLIVNSAYKEVVTADSEYMSKKYIDSHKSDSAVVADSSVISAQSYNSYNSDSLGGVVASSYLTNNNDTFGILSGDSILLSGKGKFDHIGVWGFAPNPIYGVSANKDFTDPVTATRPFTYTGKMTYTGVETASESFYGIYLDMRPIINNGHINSGGIYGHRIGVLRNGGVATDEDSGSLSSLRGIGLLYGHYNTNAVSTPITTDAFGIKISPYYSTGTISNMYDIYLTADVTGGTVTNRWGIYQANTANNYLAGKLGVKTLAPDSTLTVTGSGNFSTNLKVGGTVSATDLQSTWKTKDTTYFASKSNINDTLTTRAFPTKANIHDTLYNHIDQDLKTTNSPTFVSIIAKDTIKTDFLMSDDSTYTKGKTIVVDSLAIGLGSVAREDKFHMAHTGSYSALIDAYGNSTSYLPGIDIRHSYSNTMGTKTETPTGTYLGIIRFKGVDNGSNFDYGARIFALQQGAAGATVPTKLRLETYSSTAINNFQLVLDYNGRVGIGEGSPDSTLEVAGSGHITTNLYVEGDAYIGDDCSALTFTDRTPYYSGDAVSEIKKIKGSAGEIDHTSLPTFVKSKMRKVNYIDRIVKIDSTFDNGWTYDTTKAIIDSVVTYEDGRSLGAMISMLTVAVQQLSVKNDSLEAKIKKLER